MRELNTPLSARVQQIDDALERWRWMPTEYQQPPVLVNIPEFRLRAYSDDMNLALSMNVVVGKAAPTQTPVFTDTMHFIVFRPYWMSHPEFCASISHPLGINKSSAYLTKEKMEDLTDSSGRPGSARWRYGRRPTLWQILDTPEARPRAMLSASSSSCSPTHTPSISTARHPPSRCSPDRAATSAPGPRSASKSQPSWPSFLLRNQPAGSTWTAQRVQTAMDSGKDNVQVNLAVPVPVLILYVTAVAEEDGTIHFFYGILRS